jgi:hypothetical protein
MLNLAYHRDDFGLDAAWTFTATGHGKGAGDGVGAFLKSTARRATLSKGVRISSSKDLFDFLKKNQLETAEANGQANPAVSVSFLEANEIERVKDLVINPRIDKLRSTGKLT